MLSPWDVGARMDGRTSLLGMQGLQHPSLPQSTWGERLCAVMLRALWLATGWLQLT